MELTHKEKQLIRLCEDWHDGSGCPPPTDQDWAEYREIYWRFNAQFRPRSEPRLINGLSID